MHECSYIEIDKKNLHWSNKIQIKRNTLDWKLFYWRNKSKKITQWKIQQICCCFWVRRQILNVLSAKSGGVSIICFTSIVRGPVGIASPSFTLILSLTTGIIQKMLSISRNKKKNHDKILMLARSKFNSIESLVSQVLIYIEISHEELVTTFKEKNKYEKMKENIKNVSEKQENMRLNED